MSAVKRLINRSLIGSCKSSIYSPIIHYNRYNYFSTTTTVQNSENSDHDLITIKFLTQQGNEIETKSKIGSTLLDICLDNELDVEGACGGECCCSTCHVYLPKDLFNSLEAPDEDELDMLDLAIAVKDTSRLGCQIKIDKSFQGKTIQLPLEVINNQLVQ